MSLSQRVLLELEDQEPVTVTFDGRDLRAWETKHRKSAIQEAVSVSLLSWCGWHAAKRQGLLNGAHDTWEKFDALCTSVEGLADEDQAEDPSKPSRRKADTQRTQ